MTDLATQPRTTDGHARSGLRPASFLDPAALMRIKNLQLRADRKSTRLNSSH